MKRLRLGVAAIVALGSTLMGCPIYSSSGGGQSGYLLCDSATCFDCPTAAYSSSCVPYECATDYDCPLGYACAGTGTCTGQGSPPGSPCALPSDCASDLTCGSDDLCHVGPCTQVGCSSGFFCGTDAGGPACMTTRGDGGLPFGSDGGSGSDANDGMASSDVTSDASAGDTGPVQSSDGSDATLAMPDAAESGAGMGDAETGAPCNADVECAGTGTECINGLCTPETDFCSTSRACAVATDACIGGRCVPACSVALSCPNGYACDYALGACAGNPTVCGAGAPSCQGGAVCVEAHCLAPCGSDDDASTCPTGQMCVNGGCLPDEHAL